jgi:hypothetical protein
VTALQIRTLEIGDEGTQQAIVHSTSSALNIGASGTAARSSARAPHRRAARACAETREKYE